VSRHEAGGTLGPTLTDVPPHADNPLGSHKVEAEWLNRQQRAAYHSVAGQPSAALLQAQLEGREPWVVRTDPLTLLDFIDARVREIDAERNRLSMLKGQLQLAGVTLLVDDIRRVLG